MFTGLSLAVALSASHPATGMTPRVEPSFVKAAKFKRGINVLGYDPYWTDSSKARFKWRHFREIRQAGFDHVRINLFAFKHMDSSGTLDPAWLAKLDAAVMAARKAGLAVIIDEHDFDDCSTNVVACEKRLSAFWSQLGRRYRRQPDSVAFELLNEPHGALDATWGSLMPKILGIVRRDNPNRLVVIGPTHWNSFRDIDTLVLPSNDRNILVTFHYYEPFDFTHQGAPWTDQKTTGIRWGKAADLAKLSDDFARVSSWAHRNRRPILLGEFGAYDKSGTPLELRTGYTSAVAREAERNGFGWTYWQFDSDFIAWDHEQNRWFEPIRNALIPAGTKASDEIIPEAR